MASQTTEQQARKATAREVIITAFRGTDDRDFFSQPEQSESSAALASLGAPIPKGKLEDFDYSQRTLEAIMDSALRMAQGDKVFGLMGTTSEQDAVVYALAEGLAKPLIVLDCAAHDAAALLPRIEEVLKNSAVLVLRNSAGSDLERWIHLREHDGATALVLATPRGDEILPIDPNCRLVFTCSVGQHPREDLMAEMACYRLHSSASADIARSKEGQADLALVDREQTVSIIQQEFKRRLLSQRLHRNLNGFELSDQAVGTVLGIYHAAQPFAEEIWATPAPKQLAASLATAALHAADAYDSNGPSAHIEHVLKVAASCGLRPIESYLQPWPTIDVNGLMRVIFESSVDQLNKGVLERRELGSARPELSVGHLPPPVSPEQPAPEL